MHYKNGRVAKNGDKVVLIPNPKYSGNRPIAGILYDATPGNDACNGKIATISPHDPMPDLKDCLHAEDVFNATIPDSTRETQVITKEEIGTMPPGIV